MEAKKAQATALRALIKQMICLMKKGSTKAPEETAAVEEETEAVAEVEDADDQDGEVVKNEMKRFMNGAPKKKFSSQITVVKGPKVNQPQQKGRKYV
jgi:hypothetical protein